MFEQKHFALTATEECAQSDATLEVSLMGEIVTIPGKGLTEQITGVITQPTRTLKLKELVTADK